MPRPRPPRRRGLGLWLGLVAAVCLCLCVTAPASATATATAAPPQSTPTPHATTTPHIAGVTQLGRDARFDEYVPLHVKLVAKTGSSFVHKVVKSAVLTFPPGYSGRNKNPFRVTSDTISINHNAKKIGFVVMTM